MDIETIQKAYEIYNDFPSELKTSGNEWDDIQTIANAWNRIAPWMITELDNDEVFVFGSDETGIHLGRASWQALIYFGAEYGRAEGLQGKSYAIPTTTVHQKTVAEKNIKVFKELTEKYKKSIKDAIDEILKTKELDAGKGEKVGEDVLKKNIDSFLKCARTHKSKKFLVTRIGCGYSGFNDETVAEMFKPALLLDNVHLPQSFLLELFDKKVGDGYKCASEMVPYSAGRCDEVINKLQEQLALFHKWLQGELKKKNEGNRNLMDTVERLSNAVVKAMDLSYRGLPASAFSEVKKVLDLILVNNKEDERIISEDLFESIKEGNTFYRMRYEANNWAKKKVDRYGMFHIPMTMRVMVKSQRYSVPGYPCLYLGERAFGCWEELGRPNLSDCLFSQFVSKGKFNVLDLRMPVEVDWEKDFNRTAIRFPLVIACTMISDDHNASFKPEYVIPQLLLQYVKEYAYQKNKGKTKEEREIYGIAYTSVNYKSDGNRGIEYYQNYVLPVLDIKNPYCSKLESLFEWTDPFCPEYWDLGNSHEGDIFENVEKRLATLM